MGDNQKKTSDESEKEKEDGRSGTLVGEAVKKLFTAGITAAFMTEESVRSYLAELKLPKDMLNLIVAGATKSKEEITGRVSREIVGMIQKIDLIKEVSKFAETHKFKISAEVEILRKEDSKKS